VKFVTPPGLASPSGYTHVVDVPAGRLLFVAGQIARDANGNLVGKGDMRAQSEQVFHNIQIALESRGATLADIVQLTAYVRDMSQIAAYREVRERVLGTYPRPASSLVGVAALASDDYLLEVEVVAAPAR
jgi:enamine deaminase RidA (YjgF/YER057c/UK114 family)